MSHFMNNNEIADICGIPADKRDDHSLNAATDVIMSARHVEISSSCSVRSVSVRQRCLTNPAGQFTASSRQGRAEFFSNPEVFENWEP
jgi:hypothetical protein